MSAGPAPPNPGTPKQSSQPPKVGSIFRRRPGIIFAGTFLAGTAYLYLARPATPRDNPAITFRTPGVKNIEGAYTNAGATGTHTKAYGGTQMGDKSSIALKEGGGSGAGANKQSPFDKEGMGDEQRPIPPTKGGEIFDQTLTGSHKGK